MAVDKQRLLDSINIKTEVTELLGQPQGQRWHCYRKEAHNKGDKNASLSMGSNGYYKCHACGVRGDFFQMYMDVKGLPSDRFGETLTYFARKVGMAIDEASPLGPKKNKKPGELPIKKRPIMGKRVARKAVLMPCKDIFSSRGEFVRAWLLQQYGITEETVKKYGLGWSTYATRLFIPVPVEEMWEDDRIHVPGELYNVRKHDIMRYHCVWDKGEERLEKRPAEVRDPANTGGWKPVWTKSGKVVGTKGHNSVVIYPLRNVKKKGDIWLVGGELKAILLNQLGVNAIAFTSGEGSYANDLLGLFISRTVRIVYDIDQAGVDGAMNVGRALADAGANVKIGMLPAEGMPSNGDVTDYLRINNWDKAALDRIKWSDCKRSEKPKENMIESEKNISYKPILFNGLTEGAKLNSYVDVPVLISGRGDTPYAVPLSVKATCVAGEQSSQPKCKGCILPSCGFKTDATFNSEAVVDMTGMPKVKLQKEIKTAMKIPPSCGKPKLRIKYATVEKLVVVPTVDIKDNIDDSLYRHHRIYYISGGENIKENVAYTASGKIVGDPKDNKFTLATTKTKALDGDVFSYKFSHEKHLDLHKALWQKFETHSEVLWNTVKDLRDHVLYKYGQDTMILVEWMSWFMPFQFNIGKFHCHKVCPEVMILGPTRVGKSTMAKDLSVHFGAGRYADCGANTTFVGLIGGNADIGSSKVFTWGLIPTSHGGTVILDEYNKLSYDVMGGLTNQKSSGIAERVTNSGVRKTKAFVRYLTLCNPRGKKRLEAYDSPLDAAIGVVGTPQDLARIDFLYIAKTIKDPSILNSFHEPEVKHKYTRDLARYHLKWAWSLTPEQIKFEDEQYVLSQSIKLSQEMGKLSLVAPAEAKFKVGRVAVAIACMSYSYDAKTGGVKVTNEHVDLAYKLFHSIYGGYLRNASVKSGVLPDEIKEIFDAVPDWRKLRILSSSDRWSQEDINYVFGAQNGAKFKFLAQLEYCLVKRQGSFFVPTSDEFIELIAEYINIRKEK